MDTWTALVLFSIFLLLICSPVAFIFGMRKYLSVRTRHRSTTVITWNMRWKALGLFLKCQIPAITLASTGTLILLGCILRLFVRWPIS